VTTLKSVTGTVAAVVLATATVHAARAQSADAREHVGRLNVARVVGALDLQRGDRVADIGAGSGLFARAMAAVVGDDGVVYAVDLDSGLLAHIDEMAAEDGLTNIHTVPARPDDPLIPQPVDVITMFETLHHVQNRPAYLRKLREYLKPEGRLAIVDFRDVWPAGHEKERYTEGELARWMAAAGFRLERRYRFIENHFFLVYQKTSAPGLR
jgi:cyclopropane fatty-acyl-phospholipid synthase-like methyltransferase